ncbi:MBL fold metallo-hydrolase [Candidatus Reidiella endopervernicosa]|uniref:MBL fold metallo-hydrolase n=1 Tax=Candidatus Reidiella endopervernicosa TaxID=2738883 RepID=A0A6N0HW27_9GAMM|nr:MBL fold metallo-hydrolase [Candidatus Reidiella endopervernicosa]QKQ26548.1 MBL fold metallo-hydrolase [Candidatus Reidiella endopervernicosa]
MGDKLEGTRSTTPTRHLPIKLLKFGGLDFELVYAGPAHTVGDIFVWMPSQRIVFSGDIVYTERLLGPGPAQDTGSWVEVFEAMMSYEPVHIIPGHGHLATPAQARADTYDYLTFLRGEIAKVIEEGGDIYAAVEIDQSRFSHLKVFDLIARRNAQGVFAQMEFE